MINIEQADINKILENIKGSLMGSLKKEIRDNCVYTIKNQIQTVIEKEVVKWVEENLLPDMIILLNQHKEELLKGSLEIASQASKEIQKALSEMIKTSFSSSYKREDIIKKILGV